ncbi:MAG: 30S ribosomal protein S8 [Armatimonadetes bacterium]|nr:30S ribosomal protein S8 [Armatimonadota bacterium]
MPVTDPIADMLTRIRNANMTRKDHVLIPASKLKLEVAKVLKAQGYIQKYDLIDDKRQGQLRVHLRYARERDRVITGLRRISRPGMRVYVNSKQIPRVLGGLGIAVLSTSDGVVTDREARRRRIGGEILCYVW